MPAPIPTPMGCRHCGIAKPHGQQSLPGVGLHGWEQPTQRQIKERMLARRAIRQQAAVKRIEDRLWARMQQAIQELGQGHRGNSRSRIEYTPTDNGTSASCTYGLWNEDGTATEHAMKATWTAGVITIEMQRSVDSFDGTWGPNGRVQPDGPERLVTIDHTVYKIAPEHGRTVPGFRGFCGRRFDIELFDGRTVTTTNLWEVGTVPPKWRDRWPDTARFAVRADCQPTV